MDILEFWFGHPDVWFGCSNKKDIEITQLFGKRIQNLLLSSRNDFLQDLENIILLDQISRHVDRVWSTQFSQKYHNMAVRLSLKVIKNGLEKWTPEHICFILMPLRHSNKKDILELSFQYITLLRKDNPNNSFFRRFYHANLKSLSKFILPIKCENKFIPIIRFKDILCSTCQYSPKKEHEWSSNLNHNCEIVNSFSFIKNEFPEVVISISGGVDSMVSSFILKKLGFKVIALMINYQNRPQSDNEVYLVSSWCQKIEIPFFVTNIGIISRTNDKDRNFYEEFTKNIRFQSYQNFQRPVILGHNLDDCFENIFSNIKNKRSLDNLQGMNPTSYQLGVTLLRPMLKIRKSVIIEFSHTYNIPYLWDSTPRWSQRGKYRDYLLPCIDKYEPQLMPSLLEMSLRFKKMSEHYYQLLEQNLTINKIEENKYCIQFIWCTDIDYWRFIFQKCLQKYQLKLPSLKSLKHLISILEIGKNISGKQVMLSKYCTGYFNDENLLILKTSD